MKKNILAVLLMFILVLPVFAGKKGDKELDIKAGILLNPMMEMTSGEGNGIGFDFDKNLTLAVEFFYFPKDNLGLGLGVSDIFDSSYTVEDEEIKFGATNIYLGIKPVLPVEGFIDDVYFLGQIGYGMSRVEGEGQDLEPDAGLYWAMGVGVEKNSFLVELLYSVNYTSITNFSYAANMNYSSIGLNVGYKFAL